MKHILTDTQLWHAVRMDDEAAFNILFDRYWISLYKTAHFYLDDNEGCAESVNDVFVSIWNRRKDLEISSFSNFMQTSVRYQIYKRSKNIKLKIVFKDELRADNLFELNDGETRIMQVEMSNELNLHLDKLPKRCQEIFELSRLDRLTNQEIASRLNISKRSVENQLAISLKHLKACFKFISIFAFFLINLLS